MIPRDKTLQTKWLNAIKRKDFIPSKHHRVCSLHFKDGKKMGTTDIPKLFPLLPKPTFRKPPNDRSACNVNSNVRQSLEPLPEALDSCYAVTNHTETNEALIVKLQVEITELKKKIHFLTVKKFGLQHFAGSDDDIQQVFLLTLYSAVFIHFWNLPLTN